MGIINLNKKQSIDALQKYNNEQIQQIIAQFCFERHHVNQLYECFKKFQKKPKAFLNLDDFVQSLRSGNLNFAQLPYLQKLFTTICKKHEGQLFFQEYLSGISTFCLLNKQSVLRFVFSWLDHDDNQKIDIQDFKLAVKYVNPKTQQQSFLGNFLSDIQFTFNQKKQKFMQFQEFRTLSNRLLFLIWPAYQLQQLLRQYNLGIQFWEEQYFKIEKAQQAYKNTQKKQFRIQQKVKQLIRLKKQKQQQIHIMQLQIKRYPKKIQSDLQLLQVQGRPRRNSCPFIKITQKNEEQTNELNY